MKGFKTVIYILVILVLDSNILIYFRVSAQTSRQFNKLKEIKASVVLPSYLPTSYRLTSFNSNTGGRTRSGDIYWEYIAVYRGTNNSCFSFEGTNGALGDGSILLEKWVINNSVFGKILLEKYIDPNRRFKPWLSANLFINRSNYFFYSPIERNSSVLGCNKISLKDASNVIKSLKLIH